MDAPEPVLGIINSDLLFEPTAAWIERLPSVVPDALVVAHRFDAISLLHGALLRCYGFDCFLFDKAEPTQSGRSKRG